MTLSDIPDNRQGTANVMVAPASGTSPFARPGERDARAMTGGLDRIRTIG
jgi:hypothetical protein